VSNGTIYGSFSIGRNYQYILVKWDKYIILNGELLPFFKKAQICDGCAGNQARLGCPGLEHQILETA
jgi:hypothetical protein